MRLPFKGSYILTQEFGVNPERYKKFLVLYPDNVRRPMKGHNGLDFATPTHTEIVAPHSGIIKEIVFDKEGYGWYVKIENDEEGSVIAHLESIDIKLGYQLAEGDHIGWSDNTGNSTGPHTHWGYYKFPRNRANGIAGFIDQMEVLSRAGIHLALGKMPVIEGASAIPVMNPEGKLNYHGLDENNKESMQVVLDTWKDVSDGKYVTKAQYESDLKTAQEGKPVEVAVECKEYAEMKALGYTTIDDITKVLKEKDDLNIALQTENSKIRQRNGELAGMVQKIEEEDHTTAELGQKALDQNEDLKKSLIEVGKAAGVDKITTTNIISKVFTLKDFAEKFISKMEAEREAKLVKSTPTPKADNIQPVKTDSINWLLKIFSLIPSREEVK